MYDQITPLTPSSASTPATPAASTPTPTSGRGSGRITRGMTAIPQGTGAGDGVRTRDLLLGKQTLCQLSYSRSGGRPTLGSCVLEIT